MSLAKNFRPHTFADVVGCETAIAQLKSVLKRDGQNHIFFSGPSGTGKTTLAQIFAKALQCHELSPDQVACGACEGCMNFSTTSDYVQLDCAKHGSKEIISDYMDGANSRPLFARRRVYFFDEAHRLSAAAVDALLTPFERSGSVFLLATVESSSLPIALRSRCKEIELKLPSPAESSIFLDRICDKEGIVAEPDALALLARFGRSYRQLAEDLSKVAELSHGKTIGREALSSAIFYDRSVRLVKYLRAVGLGDRHLQLEEIRGSSLRPSETLAALQDVIVHLGEHYVVESPVASAVIGIGSTPLELLIDRKTWEELSRIFEVAASNHQMALAAFFDRVLDFWLKAPTITSEQTLNLHLLRFHNLLNENVSASANRFPQTEVSEFKPKPIRSGIRHPKGTSNESRRPHLDWRVARSFYEAATYLVQETGRTFNMHFAVDWSKLGYGNEFECLELCSRLTNDLRLRLNEWNPASSVAAFPRIILHERLQSGVVTTMVAHVSEPLHERARHWLQNHRVSALERMKRPVPEALLLDLGEAGTEKGRMHRHWSLVRKLWSGVDPELRVKLQDRSEVRLLDLLQIGVRSRRQSEPIASRSFAISHDIGSAAQKRSAEERLPHYSCLMERDYENLFEGWETDAYKSRSRELKHRAEQVEELRSRYEDYENGPDADIYRAKLMLLEQGWSWFRAPFGRSTR